jgi:hypothetical protein
VGDGHDAAGLTEAFDVAGALADDQRGAWGHGEVQERRGYPCATGPFGASRATGTL